MLGLGYRPALIVPGTVAQCWYNFVYTCALHHSYHALYTVSLYRSPTHLLGPCSQTCTEAYCKYVRRRAGTGAAVRGAGVLVRWGPEGTGQGQICRRENDDS